MDIPTTLFLFLAAALAIYIVVMIEAATDKGHIKDKLKKLTSEKEEKGEEAQGEPAEKPWPPKEEEP